MKTVGKFAMSAVLALASLTTAGGPASAMPRVEVQRPQAQSPIVDVRVVCDRFGCWNERYYRPPPPPPRRAPGVYIGPGGVYVRPPVRRAPPPPPPRYYGESSHVRWCLDRYRSYDPRTDTFLSNDGYRKRCRSPYL